MTGYIAFAPSFALPLRSTSRRTCAISRRAPVSMRAVGDPERSKDDTKEEQSQPPLVEGLVPPADFEDNDPRHGSDIRNDAQRAAGIANDDDLLHESTSPLNGYQPDDISPVDEIKTTGDDESSDEKKAKLADSPNAVKSTKIKDKIPDAVGSEPPDKYAKPSKPPKVAKTTENKGKIPDEAGSESPAEKNVKLSEPPKKVKTTGIKSKAPNAPDSEAPAEKSVKPSEAPKALKTTGIKDKTPDGMGPGKEDDNSAEERPQDMKTSVKMTPEQMEKAKATRQAAVKAATERDAKKGEQGKELLAKAENILVKVGTKSKAFELGETARAKAEMFVENAISEGAQKDAPQQEKLKGSAASAAKSLVGAITKGWQETVAPKIRETLPSEYREVSNKALASAAVGLFVAITLLPSFFPAGEQKPKQVAKKIDSETAALEKKLQRDRSAVSSYSSRSASQKAVFPPEEKLGTVTTPPKSKTAPVEPKAEKPSAKVSEAPKQAPSPQTPPSLPQTSLSSTPKPEAVTKPSTPPTGTTPAQPTTPPKPVEPVKPRETQPPKPSEVTPAIIIASVSKALGSNANLISSASFDTLAPQPTVVLEVSRAYHNMPVGEQKKLAQIMLQSTRGLGYERVSLIETGTGVEVAHAGLDVDLEDESENLRAQVGSLRKLSDKLAMQNANKEAEIDALNTRISEEREEFALQKAELEKTVKMLREETSGLTDDLAEAKAEISKMPDRMALEERTIEAERKSEKMSDTVEMLSIQLSKARNEEALAKKSQGQSIEAARLALKEKDEALASVASQIEQAQKAAENRANERIATVEREAQVLGEDANKRVREVEEKLTRTVEESKASAEETQKSYEKQLSDQKQNNEKEVQTIQSKYEAMLEEIQRRAQADLDAFAKEADRKMSVAMKEAKTFANSLTKERDDALKNVQKVEKQAAKAADKADKEKQGLQKRIERLEEKLRKKAPVVEEQPVEVESASNR